MAEPSPQRADPHLSPHGALEILYRLSDLLAAARDADALYQAALASLAEGLEADRAAILLVDAEGTMRFRASRGLSAAYQAAVTGHSPWPPGDEAPAPVLVPDAAADGSLAAFRELFAREGIGALAFYPLVVDRRVVGKLVAYWSGPRALGAEDVALGTAISHHVAAAVARARILAEAAEAGDAVERAERLARSTAAQLDAIVRESPLSIQLLGFDGTVRLWNPASERMFGWTAAEVLGRYHPAIDEDGRAGFEANLAEVARDGRIEARDVRRRTRTGFMDARLWAVRVDLPGDEMACLSVISDVTAEKHQARRLGLQVEVARILADATDLASVAVPLLEALARGLGFDAAELFTLEPGGGALARAASFATSPEVERLFLAPRAARRFARGDGLPGRAWECGAPLISRTFDAEPWCADRARAVAAGLRAALSFPVLLGAEPYGVLSLYARGDDVTGHGLDLFAETLAAQLAQLARRRRAEEERASLLVVAEEAAEESRRRTAQLRVLADVSRTLAESPLDSGALLRVAARRVAVLLGELCVVRLLDAGGGFGRTVLEHVLGDREEAAAMARDLSRTTGLAALALRTGGPIAVDASDPALSLRGYPPDDLEALARHRIHSVLVVPMRVRGAAAGTIAICRTGDARPYGDDDRVLAEEIADRLGLALEKAALFQEAELLRRRADEAAARARYLAEASRALTATLDDGAIPGRLAELLVPEVVDTCLVLGLAEGRGVPLAEAAADPAALPHLRALREHGSVSLEDGSLAARAVREGRTVVQPAKTDTYLRALEADAPERARLVRALRLTGAAVIPIHGRAGVHGYVELGVTGDRLLDEEHVRLAEELVERAGLALDNGRLYRKAQEAVSLRDDFLSVAGHELRTPLTSLQIQVSMQERLGKDLPGGERLVRGAEVIGRQVRRLGKLVDQLLDVSRLDAGRLVLEREPFDLSELAGEVVARFQPEAARAGCVLAGPGREGPAGSWDRGRLDQVLTNLVANAVKYGAGKPIEVQVRAEGGRAVVEVRDGGIGISPEELPRLFGRFERAAPGRNYGGLGLGLWISRQIVELHGGRIRVDSEPGRGSTFTVELPL